MSYLKTFTICFILLISSVNLMSVESLPIKTALRESQNNSLIMITGLIDTQVSDDKFVIKDDSGSINVHIPVFLWSSINSTSPTLNKTIKLVGIINKDSPEKTELEVISIIDVNKDSSNKESDKKEEAKNPSTEQPTNKTQTSEPPVESNTNESTKATPSTQEEIPDNTLESEETTESFNPYTNKKFRDPVVDSK